ncbi:nitroreductase family protein [Clostridium sp. DL1XJH146]
MSNLDFIYNRHSVRKFKDTDISDEDINEIIKAATLAPSGTNSQNWHFVIVKNKEKINEIAKIIEQKHDKLVSKSTNLELNKKFSKYLKYFTLFKNAPILILVFAGQYPILGLDVMEEAGIDPEEIKNIISMSPRIQNIGATVENIQLAATAMGYGACWMTGPNYAAREIAEYVDFHKENYTLACMVPIGIPADSNLKRPTRKPLEEVMTIIE